MAYADDVRAYCRAHYITPARTRGDSTITIRSGDVHTAMGYKNRMPLVCGALGSTLFEEGSRVKRVGVDGPLNGANTIFTFHVL